MPVVSKAQWDKLTVEMDAGRMSKAMFDEMVKGVDYESLPERVHAKETTGHKLTASMVALANAKHKKAWKR